jgi:hypothetical protein
VPIADQACGQRVHLAVRPVDQLHERLPLAAPAAFEEIATDHRVSH